MRTENPTAAQVDRVVRNIWERHTGQRITLNRADEFLRGWVASLKVKDGTRERYEQIVEEFLTMLGERAAFDMKAIEPAHVQAFVDRDGKLGRSGTTIVLNAKILRSAFNHAMRAGVIEKNPAGAVQLPLVINEERQPFTEGEIASLIAATKGTDWQTAILLSSEAGLRLGDAVKLQWEAVDFANGVITFIPQKTSRKGKEVKVPLSTRLHKHLDALASKAEAQTSPYVCPTLASREIGGRRGLSFEFAGIMERANVASGARKAQDKRSRQFSPKTFHSLRHAFVSRLANAGVAEDVRASLVGHADPKETERYTHLEMETRRKAVNAGRAE